MTAPYQTCTPALLDGLKQRGVKATFSLMGENIAGKESLVQRMQEEGHLIGNHSYRHIQMTKEGAEQACAEIEQTETLIQGHHRQTAGVSASALRCLE